MPEFQYKARDFRGKIRDGLIKSSSKAQAREQLKRMNLKVLSIGANKSDVFPRKKFINRFIFKDKSGNIQVQLTEKKPSTKDLIIFTKQFSTMINSGVPLIQSLGILAAQQRVPAFGDLLEKIRFMVENGSKPPVKAKSKGATFYKRGVDSDEDLEDIGNGKFKSDRIYGPRITDSDELYNKHF